MGATLTALQAGSANYVFVAAIEGYDKLLTSHGSTSAVLTAWSGTDWSTCLKGLYVDINNQQQLHPWQPFQGGGTCKLTAIPDASDTFGIDTHRKGGGASTYLAENLTRDEVAGATCKDATGFAASGEFYIGTECIGYDSRNDTTFIDLTRGKYSPFGVDGGTRFAQHHRQGPITSDGPKLNPVVSSLPRTWIGKWVGVWAHRNVEGVLDTKAQAQLVFAGRIAEIRDDPGSMGTIIEVKHVLDFLKDATVGRDMWRAEIPEGLYLVDKWVFTMEDNDDVGGSAYRVADPLTVVPAGTATPPYEINEGTYTLAELCDALNAWLGAETEAGNLFGSYTFASPDGDPLRTFLKWRIDSVNFSVGWRFGLPAPADRFLGLTDGAWDTANGENRVWKTVDAPNTDIDSTGAFEPLRSIFLRTYNSGANTGPMLVENQIGQFFDNTDTLPASGFRAGRGFTANGVFVINDKYVCVGEKDGDEISGVVGVQHQAIDLAQGSIFDQFLSIPVSAPAGATPIRQIAVMEDEVDAIIAYLLFSSGVAAYNHATYDILPYGSGVGIPGSLMSNLVTSMALLPGIDSTILVIIDKPIKLSTLIEPDLQLRWAFPRWKNQSLEFSAWSAPVSTNSLATLDESTKAAPAGTVDNHRCAAALTDVWQKAIVKISYNRNIWAQDDEYNAFITFEDEVAIDDAGGDGPAITIKARNTYSQYLATGAGIEQLFPAFLAVLPMFSRPARWITRSVDARYFEGYSVGDTVLFTDSFARDPSSGTRGIGARPAIITKHRYSLGGATPANTEATPMGGEIDLFYLDSSRLAAYGPGAVVDDTATNAGYNAGTKVLTCYAHKCSESGEAADATHFPATSKVKIIERDPADPASPLSWDDTVASQTGNTITLTTGLAGWDNTKFYRVMFDSYADCTAGQQAAYTFTADDDTGTITGDAAPFEYGNTLPTGTWTRPATADEIELPANAIYEDGASRDVGHEQALGKLLNNLFDVRTARQSPFLGPVTSGSGATGTYRITHVSPIYLTQLRVASNNSRTLDVSPFFRSSSGGSASVRVTLCSMPPWASTRDDHPRPGDGDSAVFTTTSTSFSTPTAESLTITELGLFDRCRWIWIECTALAETRGLGFCHESTRFGT